MSGTMMRAVALSAALLAGVFAARGVDLLAEARQAPQDLADKLSGTWVLNREMSTGFGAPVRGRGGRPSALFAATAGVAAQRGGGRGGAGSGDPSDLTPEQRAEQAAMRQVQQIADRMTIKASADSVTFIDSRGERTFAINDKTSKIEVAGAQVSVKSKWDKNQLKQEFSNTQARLVETWSIDDAGRLVLTAKLESMTLMTPDQKAVFDRQ